MVRPPRGKGTPVAEQRVWDGPELRRFLDQVAGDRLEAAWLTLATTGMRRSELLGLRWQDVDLDGGVVSVRQTLTQIGRELVFGEPKTRHGRRAIDIDRPTAAALRAHRKRQLEERLAWGPAYQDRDLVFCREDGSPLDPDGFGRAFQAHAQAAALPRIRLHDLRHGVASLWLKARIHPEVVRRRLGHHSAAFTLDVYSHVLEGIEREAADQVSELIFGR